jgi:hypothetical protein
VDAQRTLGSKAKARVKAQPKKVDRRPQPATERAKAAPKGHHVGKPLADDKVAPDYRQLFLELIHRANQGERLAIDRLKKFLDMNPGIWSRAGDLTAVAERAWIELLVGEDAFKSESVERRLAQLKDELKGPSPTPLEALLVDLVAASWLAVRHADIGAAGPAGDSLDQAAFRLKRAESAQRRHLAAVKTLATLRALVPQGLVPAQPFRLHDPDRELA